MKTMTATEILQSIGEFLMMDINKVKDIKYPKGELNPASLEIIMKNGKKFGVYITELKKYTE